MKVPWSWLRECIEGIEDDPFAAANALTMSGTNVEAVTQVGVPGLENGNSAGFKVGRVVEFEQHPNADRLRLCQVDVGEGQPRQIVCGASNFKEGDTVAVVLPGAIMPGGHKIGEAKLRGVASHGMMLSERELELSQDHDGIMILPAEWQPGEALAEYLPLGDTVLELEITSNRGDCLSVWGVARELAAATGTRFVRQIGEAHGALVSDSTLDQHDASGDAQIKVTVEADDLCPRYIARTFTELAVGKSPAWLRARLVAAGMRPINNVVDVTNYVMLLTGQPLHAFDAEKVTGSHLIVRRALDGETTTTLDGVERRLRSADLVIADEKGIAVIAGIMGAADVEVAEGTKSLVLEAACFDGVSVLRTSQRLGLRSESSARFEKKIDVESPALAMQIATQLLEEVCGAKRVGATVDVFAGGSDSRSSMIDLPAGAVSKVLGIDLTAGEIEDILGRLGYEAQRSDGGWKVAVPHWRSFDTTRPIDLVEEVVRIHGLDDVPSRLPSSSAGAGGLRPVDRLKRLLTDTASSMGLHEIYTWTLVGRDQFVAPTVSPVRLAHPMTEDHAELRTSLVGNALEVLAKNQSVGASNVALFEISRTYRHAAEGEECFDSNGQRAFCREQDELCICIAGDFVTPGVDGDQAPLSAGFSLIAGVVDGLLRRVGLQVLRTSIESNATAGHWLHPGCAAVLMASDQSGQPVEIGWLGVLHPKRADEHGIKGDACIASLDVERILPLVEQVREFTAIGDQPPVLEDLSVLVADDIYASDIAETIQNAGKNLVESVEVFDRYSGEGVEPGTCSLTFRLTFRAPDRTLTGAEISDVRSQILASLADKHGARLR